MIADRCIYCGSIIEYSAEEAAVKCIKCGQEMLKTEFRTERDKLKQTEAALRETQEALAVAEAEKAQADQRLFHALEDLDCLKEGQQDALSQLLRAMTQGQESTDGKLTTLQSISEKILQGQSSLLQKLTMQQQIVSMIEGLQMAQNEKAQLEENFVLWSQSAHEEDLARLDGLRSSMGTMLAEQEEAKKRLGELHSKADETQKTLDAFHKEYQEDKIQKREDLFKQAEDYQFDREFEKAEDTYRRVFEAGEHSAEIYWRILLCHYGVKYRKSDEKNQYIPTILQPDLTDPAEMSDRKNLFAQCKTEEEKQHYARELAQIDNILEAYRLHRNDAKFDVFISVKQKDGANYTADNKKATDLFYKLKEWGFKVFNSDSALTPSPAGELFEPYIISAILSSRVMIVVGTNKEYMNADWVRDEWTRFSWLKKREEKASGHSKRLLFCYLANGMQPEDIPEGLDYNIQHVIEGPGVESVLRENLKSVFPEKFTIQPLQPLQPQVNPANREKENEEYLKKRLDLAMTFIRQGRFQKAETELDDPDLLRVSPNNPDIWLCKALIRANARTVDDLYYAGPELKQNEEFKTAIEKATGALKKQLQECLMWSDYTPVQLSDGTIGITKYLGDKEDTALIPTNMKNKVVTCIMNSCFENCQACQTLLHVVIPGSVISIGSRAFAGCTSLTEITIPNSVKFIEDEVFIGCASLQAINVESNNNTYFSFDGVLFTKKQNESTLICYPQGRSEGEYILPSSVSSIAHCAFYNCTSLRQIACHDKISTIADSAFVDCPALEIYGRSGSKIEKYAEKNNIPFHDRALEEEENTHFMRAEHFLNEAEKHGEYSWSHDKDIRVEKNKAAVEELAQIHGTLNNEVNRDKYIQLVMKWKELALGSSYKHIDRMLSLVTVILVALFLGALLYYGNTEAVFYHIECPVNETINAEIFPYNFFVPIGKWFCTLLKPFGIDMFISAHSENCSFLLGVYLGIGILVLYGLLMMLLGISFIFIGKRKTRAEKREEKREQRKKRILFKDLLDNDSITDRAKVIVRIDELNQFWDGIGYRLAYTFGIATGLLCLILQYDYFSEFTEFSFLPLLRFVFLVALPGFLIWLGTLFFFDWILHTKSIIGKRIMANYNDNIKKWDERNNKANDQLFDQFDYKVKEDQSISITGYTGNKKDIIIPKTLDGYLVTSIADNAFNHYQHEGNENVYKQIVSITIPDSVTEIGHSAFYDCESLAMIIIPDSVEKIGNSAFNYCKRLESVIIPSKVTIIRRSTFQSSGLKSIVIPNGVTTIEEGAFEYCHHLEKISIPDTVYSIRPGALSSCNNLAEIVISSRNQHYCIFGGVLFDKEKHTLICYPAGKKVTEYSIPNGVTKIEDSAFMGCILSHIEIPNSVLSIGDRAFSACRKLIDVTIPNSVNSIGYRAFDDTDEITLTHNVEDIGGYAFETHWKQKGLCTRCGGEYNAFRKCKSCGHKKSDEKYGF